MTVGMLALLLVPVIGVLTEARMAVVRSTTASSEESALSVSRSTAGGPGNPIPKVWQPMLQPLQWLGDGSFGSVTKVRTTCGDDERVLVLKMASPSTPELRRFGRGNDRDKLFEMMNERNVMAEFNHPSIASEVAFWPATVPGHSLANWTNWLSCRGGGCEVWDEKLAILMEYFPGNSLYESFTKWPLWNGVVAWNKHKIALHTRAEVFVHIGKQLLAGLAEMHGKGILHMDLKPQNILLKTPNVQCLEHPHTCQVKLGDFGMACYNGNGHGKSHLTACERGVRGTPVYIAPEFHMYNHLGGRRGLGRDGKHPGRSVSTDSWAMGLLLLELWTGELPTARHPERIRPWLVEMSELQSWSRIAAEVSHAMRDLPQEIRGAVQGLLSGDPAKRSTPGEAEKLWDRAMVSMHRGGTLNGAAPGILDPDMQVWASPLLPPCFDACQDACGAGEVCFTQGLRRPECVPADRRCPAPGPAMSGPQGQCAKPCANERERSKCNYNSGVCRTTSMQRVALGSTSEREGVWRHRERMECVPHEPLAKCFGGKFMFDGCHRDSNQHVGILVNPVLSFFGQTNLQQQIAPGCGCHSHFGYEMECVAEGSRNLKVAQGTHRDVVPSLDLGANWVVGSTASQEGHCMYVGGG